MYGHTLLRMDAADQDERTRLLAYTINFAAGTEETSGFMYVLKGLFGGYPGVFSMLPYYLKVREYSDLEHRDLWEYRSISAARRSSGCWPTHGSSCRPSSTISSSTRTARITCSACCRSRARSWS